MTKSLRRRHLQIWSAWAVLLPAGIIIAWLSVQKQPVQKLLQPEEKIALPVVLKKMEKENFAVAIRSNADTTQLQLEWINKTVLTYPTATIYLADQNNNNIDKARLTGRIEARGAYYFPLDSKLLSHSALESEGIRFILFDFIHQQIIDSVKL
jgi:hypothetical protein